MYYCGVCRSIGTHFGQIPRLGLTNETGMLAMILDAVCKSNKNVKTIRKPCVAHPHKKTLSVTNNGCVDYAALVNVLLAYHKLKDNWLDDRNVLAQTGSLMMFRAYKKAKKKNPELSDTIQKHLDELSQLEKSKCSSIDRAADPFSSLMRIIFTSYNALDENKFALMGKLGYNIGKWIYLIDALNDLEADIKKGSYNCLVYKYEYQDNENIEEFKAKVSEDFRFSLEMCLASISEAWEGLKDDLDDFTITQDAEHFLDNVFYLGMRQKTDNHLNGGIKGDDDNE
ncbi:MAG TPA: hypothetical protein GXZ66_06515 [Clostridiaceae bacterium]|jgi:hypothetical protein|nr:hypothetical protein [Clostridiaceae bacterium]